jgi:hypothetical protein
VVRPRTAVADKERHVGSLMDEAACQVRHAARLLLPAVPAVAKTSGPGERSLAWATAMLPENR